MSKQKYNAEYIKYGFISIEYGEECCRSVWFAKKTFLTLPKTHLESNHAEKKERDQNYFKRLGEKAKRQRLDQTGQFHQKKIEIVKALYEVWFWVDQNMKVQTIDKTLVLPAAKLLVKNLIGEESVPKFQSVSLSNDIVRSQIQEMSVDIAQKEFHWSKRLKVWVCYSTRPIDGYHQV